MISGLSSCREIAISGMRKIFELVEQIIWNADICEL
jgi:hypothetical protein